MKLPYKQPLGRESLLEKRKPSVHGGKCLCLGEEGLLQVIVDVNYLFAVSFPIE